MCVKNHLNKITSSLLCLYLPTSNLNKRGIKYQLTALNAFQKNVLIRSPIYDTFIPLKKKQLQKNNEVYLCGSVWLKSYLVLRIERQTQQ